MSSKQKESAQPPQPPEIKRKFEFHRLQMFGVPILMLVPVLALFNLFGESFHQASASSPEVELRVDHPTRTRYQLPEAMQVSVTNVSSQTIPTITLTIASGYLERLNDVSITPDVDRITDEGYEIELSEVEPGEERQVSIDFTASGYGAHTGDITARPEGGQEARANITTFIFP